MPEQSVKQFRPIGVDVLYQDPMDPRPCDDELRDVLAYIERLENALDHLTQKVKDMELIAFDEDEDMEILHYSNNRFNKTLWAFFCGNGMTSLQALEADIEEGKQP